MVSMDYFRRPQLAGVNLSRLTYATIRGTVRRSNPSGSSGSPYFPGVSSGQELQVQHQDGLAVCTITNSNPSMSSVIDDINSALGSYGTAFDADGVIAIRSNVAGSAGYVGIAGGSAAAALGFDITKQEFYSVGGDIESGPEGRAGNPYGIAFPGNNENWDIRSFNAALGRIAANMDVIYSDILRERPILEKVTATVAAGGASITPDDSTARVFTGYGKLSRTSTKEELFPHFQIHDTTTKMPATSRVVAVVRGSASAIPGSDSPDFADTTGKNVLGQDLTKVSAVAVTEIANGRVLKAAGATFITNGVQAGDIARFTGSTNVSPWSNEGRLWVVENVVDEDTIWLRPMSKVELDVFGVSPAVDDSQPVLELNSTKAGGETYGNITVSTGTWCSGVTLVLDPPLPDGATVELWASVPRTGRSVTPASFPAQMRGVLAPLVSDYDPEPSGFILAPYATGNLYTPGDKDIQINAFLVRWNGRVISHPAVTLTMADSSTNYIYWDEKTGLVKQTTTASDVFVWDKNDPASPSSSATRGHLIAKVVTFLDGGQQKISSITNAARQFAEDVRTITVGWGGQFIDLSTAAAYINEWSDNKGEGATPNGNYPHFEIVLVSDVSETNTIYFKVPGLRIRGANPNVTLDLSAPLQVTKEGKFIFEDFQIASAAGNDVVSALVELSAVTASVVVRGVKTKAGSGFFQRLVVASGISVIDQAIVHNCDLTLTRGLIAGGGTNARFYVTDSKFTYNHSGATDAQVFSPGGGPGTWDGDYLWVSGCRFYGWYNSQTQSTACMVVMNDSDGFISFTNNIVMAGTFPDGVTDQYIGRWFYVPAGIAFIEGNQFGDVNPGVGSVKCVLNGNAKCQFRGNTCLVKTASDGASEAPAIVAGFVSNNHITVESSSGLSVLESVVIEATYEASGNYINGYAYIGIQSPTGASGTKIHDNYVSLGVNWRSENFAVFVNGSNQSIHGNYLSVAATTPTSVGGDGVTSLTNIVVSNNRINVGGAGYGVLTTAMDVKILNNYVSLETNGATGVYLTGDNLVDGNLIYGGFNASTKGIHITNGDNFIRIINNAVAACTENLYITGSTGGTRRLIHNNYFINGGSVPAVGDFKGNYCGNGCTVYSQADCSGNFIEGNVSFSLGGGYANFNGNRVAVSFAYAVTAASDGALQMTGNFFGFCSVNLTNLTNVSVDSCYFGSTLVMSGGRLANSYVASSFSTYNGGSGTHQIIGNYFAGDLNFGATSGDLQFAQNRVDGSIVSQTSGNVSFIGNRLSSVVSSTTSIGGFSSLTYSHNLYGGCTELYSGVVGAHARIFGNRFVSGTTATPSGSGAAVAIGLSSSVIRGPVQFIGNSVNGVNYDSSAVQIYGGNAFTTAFVTVVGNNITAGSGGASSQAALELLTVQGAHVIGNTLISGKRSLLLTATGGSAATACLDVTVTGNWLESTLSGVNASLTPNVDILYAKRTSIFGNTLKRASGIASASTAAIQLRVSGSSNATDALGTMVGHNRLLGGTTYIIQDNNSGTNEDDTYYAPDFATALTSGTNIMGGGIRAP